MQVLTSKGTFDVYDDESGYSRHVIKFSVVNQ